MKQINQAFSILVLTSMIAALLAGPGFSRASVFAQDALTATPEFTQTNEPTRTPTATPEPAVEPTQTPPSVDEPAAEPTAAPTQVPTEPATPTAPVGSANPPDRVVSTDAETGQVRFMGGSFASPLAVTSPEDAASQDPKAIALGFLQAQGSQFGLRDAAGLSVMKEDTTEDGRTFERFRQSYQGVPVIGGELIVQLDASKNVISANGKVSSGLSLGVTPAIDAAAAMAAALDLAGKAYPEAGADALKAQEPELWIYDGLIFDRLSAPVQKLVWKVIVTGAGRLPVSEYVLVDAQSGAVVRHFSRIEAAKNREVHDCDNTSGCSPDTTIIGSEGNPPTGFPDGEALYNFMGIYYDFFLSRFKRDSIDGHGKPLVAGINASPDDSQYDNSTWNPESDMALFGPGYVTLDIVGHEFTHGLTGFTSNLMNQGQSGAISESLSDTFGELIEQSTPNSTDGAWRIGEGIQGLPGGALRSMSDPTDFNQPAIIGDPNYACLGTDENGVHTNSGVGNKAAYLITKGGTFNNYVVTGIGLVNAAKLYYEVETHLLTETAQYPDLADALVQASMNIHLTAAQTQAVQNAVLAVEMAQTPCGGQRASYLAPTGTYLISPIGTLTTGDTLHPALTWWPLANVTDYVVQVKDSKKRIVFQQPFTAAGACVNGSCTATMPDGTLIYGENYSWTVQTSNAIGVGPWALAKGFNPTYTGIPGDISPVNRHSPGDGSTVNTILPEFTWDAVIGASSYILTINTYPAGTKPYLTMSTLPGTACASSPCRIKPTRALVHNGNYTWSVAAKFGTVTGPSSTPWNLGVNPIPGSTSIIAPADHESLVTLKPTLTWVKVDHADSFIVSITGTVGRRTYTYKYSDVCTDVDPNCTVPNPPLLEGGTQTVTVQTASAVGRGPVSAKRIFSIQAPSSSLTLSQPPNASPINNNRPTFTWSADPLATSYTLQISGSMSVKRVYNLSVCSSGTCSVRLDTTLKAGSYKWTVTATNKGGSKVSVPWSFSAISQTVPATPGLTDPPNKDATHAYTDAITLTWTASTLPFPPDEYFLKLSGPNHYTYQSYLFASDLGDSCKNLPGATCTWTSPSALAPGTYTWSITAVHNGVLGKPSATWSFRLALPVPANVMYGANPHQKDYQVKVTWDAVDTASSYLVQLFNPFSRIYYATFKAASVCSGTSCSMMLPGGLTPDSDRVSVTAIHPTGNGLTSSAASFFVERTISDEFNGDKGLWVDAYGYGDWVIASNKYLSVTSYDNEVATDGVDTYTDLDLQVYLQHTGSSSAAYGLVFHAVYENNLGVGSILTGYEFLVEPNGYFAVIKDIKDIGFGDYQYLQGWVASKAIKTGTNWNKLRVIAKGSTYRFYINDVLVWIGSDPDFGTGKIGIAVNNSQGTLDQLNVDWVHAFTVPSSLTTLAGMGSAGLSSASLGSAASPAEQVDPRQQALNDAANAQSAGWNSK